MIIRIGEIGTKELGIDAIDIGTEEGALQAIDSIKAAQTRVSAIRSDIGAQQNRLEHTVKNLDNTVENTMNSESKIRDTDVSKEVVKYVKDNIVEQLGESMLAQANQSSDSVLGLLGT